ncbi:MAG: hypothetical protein ACT4PG_07685 [Panacagrimonas sp.]
MARAARFQARRADRTAAVATAQPFTRTAHLGSVGHARQSGRGDADPAGSTARRPLRAWRCAHSLSRFDPDNLLTQQALHEALEHQLDVRRLRETCTRILAQTVALHHTERFTPLAFPLWAERISSSLSSEDWRTRIHNMLASLESAAGGPRAATVRPVMLADDTRSAAPSADPRRTTRRPRRPRMSSFRSFSS